MRADGLQKLLSADVRKKIGRGGGFGRIALGYNFFGFYSSYSGIYSKKNYFGKPYISKMKFYRPTNPQTVPQQAWRSVFNDGMAEWASFDAETKEYWKRKAKNYRMSGMNFFMRWWLKDHA